jgi:Ni,Fe-hydrogenase III large subunit
VFAILASEDDSSPALDLGHRSITKLDLAADLCVELREEMMRATHVICGSRVQYPSLVITFL